MTLNTPTKAALEVSAEALGKIMQDAWGEICDDTGAHPLDINRVKGVTWFNARHWTDLIALRLNEHIARQRPDRAIEPAKGPRTVAECTCEGLIPTVHLSWCAVNLPTPPEQDRSTSKGEGA